MDHSTLGFDYHPRTRLVFGAGTLDRIGSLAKEIGCSRALIVTDAGIVAAGHADHACRALKASSIDYTVFAGVRENPTTVDVEACLEVARTANIDAIIGLGGGSSLDTAKGCNFLLTNGGRMQDYWGTGKATKPMLPMIAVPTTAGTGSECQSFALIADEKTHQKMACGDPKAAPRIAILDPELTVSQPASVTACTGLDAIAHAVESAVTKNRNELSLVFSREAFRLTISSFGPVLEDGTDIEARAAMLLGASFGGIAIENSMLGAAHSTANPLTARFGIVHGHAVGMMLPHVIRFNGHDPGAGAAYGEIARHAGLIGLHGSLEGNAEIVAEAVEDALHKSELPKSLTECGVPESAIPSLAAEAVTQWTAKFNPREVTATDFEGIYLSAFRRSVNQ